jgi:mevalonate pyrophosphate decarboxylase
MISDGENALNEINGMWYMRLQLVSQQAPNNIGLMSSAVGMSAIASFLQKRRPLLQCNLLVSASKDGAESELLLPVAGLMCDT